jgi:hypothetical protein
MEISDNVIAIILERGPITSSAVASMLGLSNLQAKACLRNYGAQEIYVGGERLFCLPAGQEFILND